MAVGATAATYELLAKPVQRKILFAGEHTCKVSQCYSLIVYEIWVQADAKLQFAMHGIKLKTEQ